MVCRAPGCRATADCVRNRPGPPTWDPGRARLRADRGQFRVVGLGPVAAPGQLEPRAARHDRAHARAQRLNTAPRPLCAGIRLRADFRTLTMRSPPETAITELDLLGWKREVFGLYQRARELQPEAAWREWCAGRDRLFATHLKRRSEQTRWPGSRRFASSRTTRHSASPAA